MTRLEKVGTLRMWLASALLLLQLGACGDGTGTTTVGTSTPTGGTGTATGGTGTATGGTGTATGGTGTATGGTGTATGGTGTATGGTGTTTGGTGTATGGTGTATGSTGTATGSTGTATGSTGTATGSTGTATGGTTTGTQTADMSLTKGAAYFSITLDGSVNGKDLSQVTGVQFNGVDALSFYAYPGGTKVVATAPRNVSTGPVVVKTSHGDVKFAVFEVVAAADPEADFAARDLMPQTEYTGNGCSVPFQGSWGPTPNLRYAKARVPAGVNAEAWKRARVLAAAFKWLNLPYQHHHIPSFDATGCANLPLADRVGPGLDCSNFTTWIYTYAFGYNFTSDVVAQAEAAAAGTLLAPSTVLQPGDLLFARGSSGAGPVTHVSIYIDPGHRIDATDAGVKLQPWGAGSFWPHNSLDRVRRPLDLIPTL